MIRVFRSSREEFETSPAFAWIAVAGCLMHICFVTFQIMNIGPNQKVNDFDVFYTVGNMIAAGNVTQAYDFSVLNEVMSNTDEKYFMIAWTYPPVFNLVVAPLPLVPQSLSFFLFMSATFLAYIMVLWRLAGHHLSLVLFAVWPAFIFTVKSGQNGFLTAALIGWFCIAFLKNRSFAGVPLGFMVIKPHLAVGLGVLALTAGRWRTIAVAAGVAGLLSAIATLAFGAEVWPAFLSAVRQSGSMLEKGEFPLERMTSVYAAAYTWGAPASIAIAAQLVSAGVAIGMIVYARMTGLSLRQVTGIAVLATLAISPYNYDYDMPILGVGLAILARDLLDRASLTGRLLLLTLSLLSVGWGQLFFNAARQSKSEGSLETVELISVSAVFYFLLLCLTLVILRVRPDRNSPAGDAEAVQE